MDVGFDMGSLLSWGLTGDLQGVMQVQVPVGKHVKKEKRKEKQLYYFLITPGKTTTKKRKGRNSCFPAVFPNSLVLRFALNFWRKINSDPFSF